MKVTADKVRTKLGLDSCVDVELDLEMAYTMRKDIESKNDSCMSSDKLDMIELLLACHYASLTNRRVSSKSIAGGSTSWESTGGGGQGFLATSWGGQAVALDCTGTLTNETASVIHLGEERS